MKALLLKLRYTEGYSIAVMILFTFIFSPLELSRLETGGLLVALYSVHLVTESFERDIRCKWDMFAQMMPYTESQIVRSKYYFAYSLLLGSTICSLVFQLMLPFVVVSVRDAIMQGITNIGIVLIVIAIILPLSIGRRRFFGTFILVMTIMFATTLTIMFETTLSRVDIVGISATHLIVFLSVALVSQFISIPLSIGIYRKNKRRFPQVDIIAIERVS